MLDLDNDLDRAGTTRRVVSKTATPQVRETLTVIPASDSAGYKARPVEQWNWTDLRDYIVVEIEKRHGPQVRDPKKEAGVVKGFISRWGIQQAHAIARAAFEVHDGWWRNAPISINRFTRGSDPYFASVIAERL